MKNTSKLFALAAFPFLLVGCTVKVDFSEFQDAVEEAYDTVEQEDIDVETMKIKGEFDSKDYDIFVEEDSNYSDFTTKELAVITYVAMNLNVYGYAADENPEYTYYAGNGFKIVCEEDGWTKEYDKYDFVTRITDEDDNVDLKISYKYDK